MDFKSIPLGVQPSPEDKRDYPISKIIASVNVFPKEFIIPYNHEIKDQGSTSSCVGHSLAYCREITEEIQNKKYTKFSPGFIYANRSKSDYQGEGMYPREALKHLQDEGAVPYDMFPYLDSYSSLKNRINQQKKLLLDKAYPYRITTYCKLYSINDIKNALIQLNSAVTICYPIYNDFYNIGSNGIAPVINNPSMNPVGYHEMSIIGYKLINNKEYWVVLNSWSSNFGDRGKCYIPIDNYITEAWSITDNIYEIHPEPEPEKQKYYRVQMAAFKSKEGCLKYQQKIFNETGWKSYIVFIDGLYKLQMNCFVNKINAQNFSKQLKSMGYQNFITYY